MAGLLADRANPRCRGRLLFGMIVKSLNDAYEELPVATMTIPDETYQKLQEEATRSFLEVAELVSRLIEKKPETKELSPKPTVAQRKRILDDIRREADSRAHMYPPGFQVDCDRDSIYRETEDARS